MSRLGAIFVAAGVIVAVVMASSLWPNGSDESSEVAAGSTAQLQSAEVTYLADHRFYVVATADGPIALSDDARHIGDRVLYCAVDGTFSSPAHGERFDRLGRYVAGPASGDMGRFALRVTDGDVVVDVSNGPHSPDRSDAGSGRFGRSPCEGAPEGPPGFYDV